ncbi:MFS transporter [Actinophytocola sp.]|uniref:MFS transporter n=1 Tax=Actinophytocola sp. TaxID=1872138 RepID=UPI002D7FDE6D|nr:MFS transporter [Actinophytocola sp.]HET9139598.1 MFS transporter [Actinophytocola sp.]
MGPDKAGVGVPDAGVKAGAGVLAATCISTLIVNANTSAVSILLPAISEDVGASTSTLQWAVTGYSLVGAAVIVTSGVLGDIAGRRKVFIGGLVLFIASCALIALSTGAAGVIVGRLIQGAAGSTLLACGLSLLSVASSGAAELKAVSLWGAASAVGAAIGPLIGGALVDSTGWQGLFWIDAGIAVLCIPLTLLTVAESRDPNRPRSIDLAGTVLVAVTLAPLVLGLSKGPEWGWTSLATLGCLAVSVAAGYGFFAVEGRVKVPLVNLALLRNRVLVASTIVILIVAGGINGLMFVLSLYFQDPDGLGMSPLQAGAATLPAVAGLVLVAPFVSRLAVKIGSRAVIGLGFIVTTVGFLAMLFVSGSWAYGAFVLPLIAIAVGMGFSNGCASSAATVSVPESEVGAASGISNMARYVGAALFVAAASTIYSTAAASTEGARDEALAGGVAKASLLMMLPCVLGLVVAALYRRHRLHSARAVDQATAAAGVVHTVPRIGAAAR